MKKAIIILFFLIMVLPLFAQYPGTNVRGQVQIMNYNRYVPYSGVSVCLYQYRNYNWVQVANTVTNEYGFYFFYGIPPDQYFIQVNWAKNYPVQIIFIDYRFYQFQDIPILYY